MNIQNQEFNPQVAELRKRLAKKYSALQDQNRSDETAWTGAGVFILHCIIAVGTCSIVANFNLSKFEGLAMGLLAFGLSIVIEFLKSRYQERFLTFDLIYKDEDLQDDERNEAYKEKGFNAKILSVIYVVSALFFVANGVMYAKKVSPPIVLNEYDMSIKTAYDQKTKNINYAQERGYKVARIKEMQIEADEALGVWKRHKEAVDIENATLNSENDQTKMIYVILAIGLCVLLEVSLFWLRQLHETKQYKIAKKVMGSISSNTPTAQGKKTQSDDVNRLNTEIKELKEALKAKNNNTFLISTYIKEANELKKDIERLNELMKVKDDTISFYKEKSNLLAEKSTVNGHSSSKQ